MHPVLADTNTVIDILFSSALYLSFQAENLSTESRNEKNNKETSDKQNGITLSERSLSSAAFETKKNQNKYFNFGSKKKNNYKTT